MSEVIVLPEPTKIKEIDPLLLEDVATAFAQTDEGRAGYVNKYYDFDKNGNMFDRSDLTRSLKLVEPSIRAIMELAGVEVSSSTSIIVESRQIQPGKIARVPHWHVDRKSETVAVTNALPPEFLVGELDKSKLKNSEQLKVYERIVNRARTGGIGSVDDRLVNEMGLGISSALPNFLTYFDGYKALHRSAKNISGATVKRTWVRFTW